MNQRKPITPARLLISFLLSVLIVFGGSAYSFRPDKGDKDIILYTTEWCPYCNALRVELTAHHISFIERDIEKSLTGFLGFIVLGGRGVPVSVVGEDVIKGYQRDHIEHSLAKLGYQLSSTE